PYHGGAHGAPARSGAGLGVPASERAGVRGGAPIKMDRELLIEIGVEELPAAWMPGLTRQLGERLEARLKEARIAPGAPVETYSTPRRLTARLAKIAERQEDLEEVVTGPPVSAAFDAQGQPTPAAIGFAKKQGVTVEELGRAASPRGEYLTF